MLLDGAQPQFHHHHHYHHNHPQMDGPPVAAAAAAAASSGFGPDFQLEAQLEAQLQAQQAQSLPLQPPLPQTRRKRKADSQPENNERLSKRLSLLNLEQNGSKLYVPVENPIAAHATTASPIAAASTAGTATIAIPPTSPSSSPPSSSPPRRRSPSSPSRSRLASTPPPPRLNRAPAGDDSMQLDDTKYKVYIYNIDDELSSESEPEDARLAFLPDIDKHLRSTRIPAHLLAKPDAGLAGKELVLYRVPSSLSVPEEHDSVRKAIIEARARVRARQDLVDKSPREAETPAIAPMKPTPLPTIPEQRCDFALPPPGSALSPGLVDDDTDVMDID